MIKLKRVNKFEIKKYSAGHYSISGVLDKSTVTKFWKSRQQLQPNNKAIILDLTNITHSDSAGLALLIGLQKEAIKLEYQLSFIQIPEQLQQLIELSHLQDILKATQGI